MPPECSRGGELDAYFHPSPPPLVYERTDRIRPLFSDSRSESIRYFHKLGYCPIMHVMVFPKRVVEEAPWLPGPPSRCGREAKEKTLSYYADPGYSLLLFSRNELDAQREALKSDPWVSGTRREPRQSRAIHRVHGGPEADREADCRRESVPRIRTRFMTPGMGVRFRPGSRPNRRCDSECALHGGGARSKTATAREAFDDSLWSHHVDVLYR